MSFSSTIPTRDLPTNLNIRLAWLFVFFFGSFQYAVPILLLLFPGSFWIGLPVAISTGPVSYALWNLIHESIHGNFSNNRSQNQFWGRCLAILFGTQFAVLKAGHLMHHKYNREAGDRIEFFDPISSYPRWLQSLRYYFRITLATYCFEVAVGLFLALPTILTKPISARLSKLPIEEAFFKWVYKPEILTEIRKDLFFTAMVYAPSVWLFGTQCWILGIAVLLRAFFVSFFDNAYHYGKEIDDKNSAYNLYLPFRLSGYFLHFNYHRIHHRFPGVPWNRLPVQMEASGDIWDRGFWGQAWSQWGGLLDEPRKD
ncbi:stearoyl-CoA 9-desaturase [Leptospira inadai serovar Lyme str. 10]|uniref:Stearoyl-CoA 9-desaturase n=2 Tax=Leptospira inadai serovar Lyme TaxID=293084 RepID=V6HC62_9LEPT|nr:fatty acid desaturase [Leptospira inadai]EQA36358.1 stearoyl-CoA 9-desaturase [Leptospira inadai serovar Lyme str. 10]PNV75544.1 stearoyl-CoA 9-desaturase [Leptospira inadai serovar Lyme]